MSTSATIPGYTYGTDQVPRSPVDLQAFQQMQKSVMFDEEDVAHLRLSHDILRDQVEAILDVWYGFVGSQPHLLATFHDRSGQPDGDYLARVRERFGRWILDTARAEYDQRWLDYQHEIALRHHRTKKNRTDGVDGGAPIVPFRDLFLLLFPVTHTLRPFLAAKGHPAEVVDRMHQAWLKSCLLQLTLWSHPYVRDGDF